MNVRGPVSQKCLDSGEDTVGVIVRKHEGEHACATSLLKYFFELRVRDASKAISWGFNIMLFESCSRGRFQHGHVLCNIAMLQLR